MTQEIATRVLKIVAAMAPTGGDAVVGADTQLVEDLGYHSLALLELAIQLEVEFGMPTMEAGSVGSIRTVGDVVGMVTAAVSAPATGVAAAAGFAQSYTFDRSGRNR
ncbi:phosphopantetheine-binding protein [Nocardia concava]|uniref:phosphopantetheine-binding protein n=1 Tax=Nocardia concava TaxID=257281 RepID=UPI001C3F31EE|nr:phosphopantetheine-binding protein [Nocardia concava]